MAISESIIAGHPRGRSVSQNTSDRSLPKGWDHSRGVASQENLRLRGV